MVMINRDSSVARQDIRQNEASAGPRWYVEHARPGQSPPVSGFCGGSLLSRRRGEKRSACVVVARDASRRRGLANGAFSRFVPRDIVGTAAGDSDGYAAPDLDHPAKLG